MSSKNHRFNPEIAVRFGIIAAIIIHHLWFWTIQNIKNRKNYYDGSYWTYDSIRVMTEHFPYLTEKMIRGAIERLVTQGILKTGNYNKTKYDRTLWYALTDKGISIVQKCYMDLPLQANGSAPSGEPIPDVTTDIVTYEDTDAIHTTILSYLNEKAGTTYTLAAETKRLIDARLADGFKPDEFVMVVDCMVGRWKDDIKMAQYLRPKTLFGCKMRQYLDDAQAAASNRLSDLDDVF